MAKYSIYSAAGVLKAEGCPTYTGTYMKPGMLDFREIGSAEMIEWEVGDYVGYEEGGQIIPYYSRTGLRYSIYQKPQLKKQARRRTYGGAFLHQNVQLYDDSYQLQICPFRDLVVGGNRIHFSTQPQISVFNNVAGIAERIQACLEDMYGAGSWVVRTAKAEDGASEDLRTLMAEEKEFAVSNVNLLQVLDKVYELWPEVGWIYKVEVIDDVPTNTIVIGGGGLNSQVDVYAYGKGHGLLSLQRTVANADELANRLYVYGSDKNMLPRWYNQFNIKDADSVDIQHLMLPISVWGETEVDGEMLPDPAKAFIDADGVDTSNLRPRVVYFDGSGDVGDIYPTIKNLTAGEARSAIPSGTQYRPSATIYDDEDPLDVVLAAQNPTDNGLAGNSYGQGAAQSETLDFSGANGGTIGADEEISETIFSGSVIAQSAGKYNITVILTPIAPSSISGDITGVRLELNVMGQVWQLSLEGSGGGAWYPAPVTARLNGITLPASGAIGITATLYLDNKGNDEDETVSWSLAGTIAVSLAKTRETTFYVTIPQIGFDIEEMAALGDGKTIAFTSGMCAGRTFPIKSAAYLAATDSWRLEVIRTEDESLAQYFPNTGFPIAAGDKFVLLDIAMPPYLINVAEGRLLAAAQELLAYTSKEIWQYVPEIDAKYMEEHGKVILPAEYIALTDDELFALQTLSYFKTSNEVYYLTENGEKILLAGSNITEPVLVDSVTIAEGEAAIATYKVTLRDRKKKKYNSNASVPSTSSRPVATSEVTPTPQPAASEYFEEDGNGGIKLKDEYNGFWASGYISAGGSQPGGGGGGGVDMGRVWQDLTNDPTFNYTQYTSGTKIGIGHIPMLDIWRDLANDSSIQSYDVNTKIALSHIPDITTGKISNLGSWTGSQNITTLGTITTGTWNGSAIPVSKGGTGRTRFDDAPGAVLVASGYNVIGHVTNNSSATRKYLSQVNGGVPTWESISVSTPKATDSTIGGFKTGYTSANKNYAVQLDSNDKAFVNVPWSDNNTTYKLTVNGTEKGTSGGTDLGSIYAPTTSGTSGYVLASSGAGAPSWINNPTFAALRLKQPSSNYGSYLYFGDDAYAYIHEDTDDHLLFYAANGITIDSATVIGSTTSNKNLTIYGSLYIGASAYWNIDTYSRMHTNADVKIDGAVIVGGTSSNKDLTVFGKLRLGTTVSPAPHYLAYDSSTPAIYTDTNFYAQGFISAGGVSSSSDARLKTNIKNIKMSLADVANAPAVEFDWIDKAKGRGAGSIAQYWESVLPLNVRSFEDGKALEYGNIALISAIIVARRVRDLEEEIKELRARI